MKLAPRRHLLLAFFFSVTSALSSQAIAFPDVLDTPSRQTALADSSLLTDVAMAGQRIVAVGERGHIVYSDDKGETWTQASVPVSVLLTAVDFPSKDKGWAVGHGGAILHSQDGGVTWSKQFDGNQANQSMIAQAEKVVEELEAQVETASEDELGDIEYELEEAVFSLEDAQFDAEVGASKPFLDVMFTSATEGFAVGAYGFMFKTEDGGQSWMNYGDRIDNMDRLHLNAITRMGDGTFVIVGEAGSMYRSTDAGESWETLDSPYEGSFFGVIGTQQPETVLAFGLRGNLYRSDDSGLSWDPLESNTELTLMSAGINDSNYISIAGNSGIMLLSRDGGRTFEPNINDNRQANLALVYSDTRKLVTVGESGALLMRPSGKIR